MACLQQRPHIPDSILVAMKAWRSLSRAIGAIKFASDQAERAFCRAIYYPDNFLICNQATGKLRQAVDVLLEAPTS
jgi:hypothetical protein